MRLVWVSGGLTRFAKGRKELKAEQERPLDGSERRGIPGGVFITFEGADGVGKTTQITLLRDWLIERGREVVCLHEPGGTDLGERIRSLLLGGASGSIDARAELMLFEAARAQLVAQEVRPALARGAAVLCDRFTDSTIAYQGYGRELGANLVARLNEIATGGLEPDLTLLLVLDGAEAERRLSGRAGGGPDRMERAGTAFRARVRQGFSELAGAHPERIRPVDASRPVEDVHRAIAAEVGDMAKRAGLLAMPQEGDRKR